MDDLRHALRTLWKQRGFAAVAILTLAFGIGLNISLFGMLSAFFLQPLAVRDADRLVIVMQRSDAVNVPYGHSYPDYLDYRSSTTAFSELAAFMPHPAHVSARGQTPERTWIEVVSPNYFVLAGVAPAFGEFPRPEDGFGKAAAPTVVVSHRYWQRRFGGDPSLVGRQISINGRPFTVSGIAPATFTGLSWAMAVSAFVPAGALGTLMDGGDRFREDRGTAAWRLMGRLGPGKTLRDARTEIDVVSKRLAADYPAEHKGTRALTIPENRARPDPSLAGVLPVFAAVFAVMVGLVLLIACANVANLMFARALARQRDLVIRSALGASRVRLIRLQIVETLVLACVAGVAGLLLARWAGGALAGFVPAGDIPINEHREWDWRIYVFTLGISILAGIVTGLWPARNATRFDLVASLKDGGSHAGTARHALRSLLVIGQVTMSFVVLASAALFVHSLRQMQHLALGFEPRGVLLMSVDLDLQQYSDQRARRFIEDFLRRAEATPGVTSATAGAHLPFDYGAPFDTISIDGDIPGSKDSSLMMPFTSVGPRFFETTGTAIRRGRAFDNRDNENSARVGVINETMARKLWPGRDPLGRRFRIGRQNKWIEVVGVAADGKYLMLAEQPRPYFYLPLSQDYRSPMTIVVRAAAEPGSLAAPLQRLLNEMDPDLPVFNVRTMESHIRGSVFGLMPLRMGAAMAGMQGLVGLLLAIMGLYAVVAYGVARRTREIGVRIALGARGADVVRLVVREGMWLSAIGCGLGLMLALGIGAGLSAVLYGLKPVEAPVFLVVAGVVLVVSALACYMPARRATRVDPILALRCD
jgi:putative ABC transport system permease protein